MNFDSRADKLILLTEEKPCQPRLSEFFSPQDLQKNLKKGLILFNKAVSQNHTKKVHLAYRQIRNISINSKRKQEIYESIYRTKRKPKNELPQKRKIRQENKIQTAQKQTEQSFFLSNNDISSIKMIQSEVDSTADQSRINLENIFQLGFIKQNNFIQTSKKIGNKYLLKEKNNNQFKRYSEIDHESAKFKYARDSSDKKNFFFQTYHLTDLQINKDFSQEQKECQKIEVSSVSLGQNKKSIVQQIHIFSDRQKKLFKQLRPRSLDNNIRSIQIPLISQKIQVFQYPISIKKQKKTSQSLSQKNTTKKCFQDCQSTDNKTKCKFCSMIQKSNQIIQKIKLSIG